MVSLQRLNGRPPSSKGRVPILRQLREAILTHHFAPDRKMTVNELKIVEDGE
jgi:DNA-binding GntR family transcriptional regulator